MRLQGQFWRVNVNTDHSCYFRKREVGRLNTLLSTFMSEKKEVMFGVGEAMEETFQSVLQLRLRNAFQSAKGVSWELSLLMHMGRGGKEMKKSKWGKGSGRNMNNSIGMKGFLLSPEIPNKHMTIFKIGRLLTAILNRFSLVKKNLWSGHLSSRMSVAWETILQLCSVKFAHSRAKGPFSDDFPAQVVMTANSAGYYSFTFSPIQINCPPFLCAVPWEADLEIRGWKHRNVGVFLPYSLSTSLPHPG